jgi:ketosteroid isomerase-like protein
MNTRHVDAYFKALSDKETKRFAEHLSEDIVLLSPVFPDPFEGKETVVKVLTGLLETIDSIRVELTFASGSDVAVFFSAGITVKGAEHRPHRSHRGGMAATRFRSAHPRKTR